MNFYAEAIPIQLKELGRDHPDLAASFVKLAVSFAKEKRYDDAISYLETALEIQGRGLPPGHPDFVVSYYTLGWVYSESKNYEKSLESYNKALDIAYQLYGEDHKDTKEITKAIKQVKKQMK